MWGNGFHHLRLGVDCDTEVVHESYLAASLRQREPQALLVGLEESHMDFGVGALERLQNDRCAKGCKRCEYPDRHLTFEFGVFISNGGQERACVFEESERTRPESTPRRRQLQGATSEPEEKGLPHFVFELCDRRGHRRLRDGQQLRGRRHAAGLGDSHEVPQLRQGEVIRHRWLLMLWPAPAR